jgi:hypothetical protein
MTGGEVVAACRGAGGLAAVSRGSGGATTAEEPEQAGPPRDGDTILCYGNVPVDPFDSINPASGALIKLCDYGDAIVVCEVHLLLSEHTVKAAAEVRARLEDRYGPITLFEPAYDCRNEGDRAAAFSGSLLWRGEVDGKQLPLGHLLFNYICTPQVSRPEIFLAYRDGLATFRHLKERNRRGQEF